MLTLFIFYLGSGILLVLLSLPLLARKIKPNPIYGFRIEATLKDPQLWYETNRYFSKWQVVVGLTVVLVSTGLFFWPGLSVDLYALTCLGAFVVVFTIAIFSCVRFMKELKAPK